MFAFAAAIRIYVAVQPVDMRKSFNGLWSDMSEQSHEDPKMRCVVRVHQQGAHAAETRVLGRYRRMGAGEAARK